MKKRVLTRLNIVLGTLSLLLAGCHTSKKVTQDGTPPPLLKYGIPPEVRAMYGVPTPDMPADTLAAPADTVVMPQKPVRPKDREPILVKYGVPPMRD